MANLRIVSVNAADSRLIKARFTQNLSTSISASNILIESSSDGTPDVIIQSVGVSGDVLTINTYPMTPFAPYKITFKSIQGSPFTDVTGRYSILDDGRTNIHKFTGPEDPDNIYRADAIESFIGSPYDMEIETLSRAHINGFTEQLKRLVADVKQAKNQNYLSSIVKDERKTRGYGPWDRLAEEGAYEVLRVGLEPENQDLTTIISYSSFPFDVISLQSQTYSETLYANVGFDNLNLFLTKYPVTKVTSIRIVYANSSYYDYDLNQFGYLIKDPRYDTDHASRYLLLEDNGVKLSDRVLDDPAFVMPYGSDEIRITYEYKNQGVTVDFESVEVYEILDSVREQTEAIVTQFSLKYHPVVTTSGSIPSSGGVQFLDPEGETPFRSTHPAFLSEIPFRLEAPPSRVGEYSVDYESGRVYVYGAVENDGTGYFPPAATYKYKYKYVEGLDYNIWEEVSELAANSQRDLIEKEVKISFNYEQDFVSNVDYKANVHVEALNERINNRINSSGAVRVANSPITNVFKIFNETTGEMYKSTRFFDNVVYFTSKTPPSIKSTTFERASFHREANESLVIFSETLNTSLQRILKVILLNQNIIGVTEDCIGSSFNSGASFSRNDLFQTEFYYDPLLSESINIDKLTSVGGYLVDYRNGIIYVSVANSLDESLGTVSYILPKISPQNSHVVSVSNLYTSLDVSFGVNTQYNYTSFNEGEIVPTTFEVSDERFLNGDTTLPYIVDSGTITVSSDIKRVRHIYDAQDLNGYSDPIDFVSGSTHSANVITLGSVEVTGYYTVQPGLTIPIDTHSTGISLDSAISVVRQSDGQQLLDGYETISGNDIALGGSSGAIAGDYVFVIASVSMNGGATPVVDYDKGEYYIDYTYLFDEILVSYEYGDNVVDFRESNVLEPGDTYYVTYRVGALRDSLLANFGSMISIDELNSFDTDFDRERYRDALIGAFQSFSRGPTKASIEDMIESVSKTKPEIIEAAFMMWGLGISRLGRDNFALEGDPSFVPGKFDNGILFEENGQYVKFPASSNIRLEEGTLEMWVKPQWNGIDNDSNITISSLQLDGNNVDVSAVFIGSASENPTEIPFTIKKEDATGLPSAVYTAQGVFVYYDEDGYNWKVLVNGDSSDGYTYSGVVATDGEFYNVKAVDGLLEGADYIRSSQNSISFSFALDDVSDDGYTTGDGYVAGLTFDGLSFSSDKTHYLFDMGEGDKNRMSLFKDGKGYLNFMIYDNGPGVFDKSSRRNRYQVSADISRWELDELHHVAIGWRVNSYDSRDEMHMFIDGEEVPNIIRYGGYPSNSSSDIFRTVVPEIILGAVPKLAIAGNDLQTSLGSTTVTSSTINFQSLGILPGDTIEIRESGFSLYNILLVSGASMVLDVAMPATLSDARFSVNPYSATVETEIDIYQNIAVSKYYGGVETEIPGTRAEIPGYEITRDPLNNKVLKILGTVEAGAYIYIRTLGKNHRRCREKIYLYGPQSILKTQTPPPVHLDDVFITAIPLPLTTIGPSNSVPVGWHVVAALTSMTQPTNQTEGRTLSVRITGHSNADFSAATTVTIDGYADGDLINPTSEVMLYYAAGKQDSTKKWCILTSVTVDTRPYNALLDTLAVEVREKYSVTNPDANVLYPVIRYSYQTQSGTKLNSTDGYVVTDGYSYFVPSDVGRLLRTGSTVSEILTVDTQTQLTLDGYVGSLIDQSYSIYDVTIARSGLQNGYFFLEEAGNTLTPYYLPAGHYEIDFATYLKIGFDPISNKSIYIGNSSDGLNPANAVVDEVRILNELLTDTRVGETIGTNEDSVTTDALMSKAHRKDSNTLVLLHLDSYPIVNDTDFYVTTTREYLQSGSSVNDNFGSSVVFSSRGIKFDNENRLDTSKEGTVEFWVSPRFDTYNDPIQRYYFDATSIETESANSLTKGTVQTVGRAISVISVKILGSDVNYFTGGSIGVDRRTITLGKPLPYQNMPVTIEYIPTGLNGDRMSIYKDVDGTITFSVRASGNDFTLKQPVFWSRDTWHRVRVSYIFNSSNNRDEMRMFLDGEERGMIRFGSGIVFGTGLVFGQTASTITNASLTGNIDFTDSIQEFHIGQNAFGKMVAQARIDNFRISNKALSPVVIGGWPIDANYDTSLAYPVIENAYTTFLMDFSTIAYKATDFAVIRDPVYGVFNFAINIIDSFGIVSGSQRVNDTLFAMINALKPAASKVDIEVVR